MRFKFRDTDNLHAPVCRSFKAKNILSTFRQPGGKKGLLIRSYPKTQIATQRTNRSGNRQPEYREIRVVLESKHFFTKSDRLLLIAWCFVTA